MKNICIKLVLMTALISCFAACKREDYPDQLHFLVIDTYSRKPIPNATLNLYKVWQHPVKVGNNAKDGAWFPDYGRKHITETQIGVTDENGKLSLTQDHKKYLYILPAVSADGYQSPSLDTLGKMKRKGNQATVYEITMQPLIKTTFILKSHESGLPNDSVVFSSCDKVKVMRGANIDDRLEVLTSNNSDPYSKVWYGGTIYRNGKKVTLCHYVVSQPNAKNEFAIDIDL